MASVHILQKTWNTHCTVLISVHTELSWVQIKTVNLSLRSWAYSNKRVFIWIWFLHTEKGRVGWNVTEGGSRQCVLTTLALLQERLSRQGIK